MPNYAQHEGPPFSYHQQRQHSKLSQASSSDLSSGMNTLNRGGPSSGGLSAYARALLETPIEEDNVIQVKWESGKIGQDVQELY